MSVSFERTFATALAGVLAAGLAFTGGPAKADLLSEIKKRGEFVVGTEARFPPFIFSLPSC